MRLKTFGRRQLCAKLSPDDYRRFEQALAPFTVKLVIFRAGGLVVAIMPVFNASDRAAAEKVLKG